MRVTKWGECGILCSLYLAERYGAPPVGAAEIAETQGLDLPYTQQILQKLRKGEVIESARGPKGGYTLQRKPDEITLKDILYAVEGDTFQIICDHHPLHPDALHPTLCATRESCGLHGVWQDLRAAIDKLLEERTLADLLKKNVLPNPLVQLGANRSE
jgi:Rrf2 family iron-sulfur cluster assembly transcriptional regulator